MAVHIPLSASAQAEHASLCSRRATSSRPRTVPDHLPTQDMVIGSYYLAEMVEGAHRRGPLRSRSLSEASMAYDRSRLRRRGGAAVAPRQIQVRMPASKFPEDRFPERSDARPRVVVIKRSRPSTELDPSTAGRCCVETTLGRLLFNEAFPADFPFVEHGGRRSGT